MKTQTNLEKPSAKPAHLAWRLLALLYDAVIAIALLMCASALLLLVRGGQPVQSGSLASVFAGIVFCVVLGVYAVISWKFGGQTLGMRPWRLQVLDLNGNTASWKALVIRYVVVCASAGLTMLWCLLDPHYRGLHDVLAKTILVRLQAKSS